MTPSNANDDAVEAELVKAVAQAIADEMGQFADHPDVQAAARAAIEAMRAAQPVEAVTRGMVEAGIEDASAKVGLILDAEDVSVIYLAMRAAHVPIVGDNKGVVRKGG